MLFQFQLRPLGEVTPWGEEGAYSLHWFGLTDGWYWLKCGNQELFRYSEALLATWSGKGLGRGEQPYVDYHVVRLWEDILDMLPEILSPVPKQVLELMQPGPESFEWCGQISELGSEDEVDAQPLALEHYFLAVNWIGRRKLDAGCLLAAPRIWLWTDGITMFIRWDNRDQMLEGHPAWASREGTFTLPLDAFMEEVRSFDRRLIQAMQERIQTVAQSWVRPEIQIDVEALLGEQEERATWLSLALERARTQEPEAWDKTVEAIKRCESLRCSISKPPG